MCETRGNDIVVTFHSTHQAILAEKLLGTTGIQYDMIPTPRQISAGCGLSLELNSEEASTWLPLFTKEHVIWGEIYARVPEGFEQWNASHEKA